MKSTATGADLLLQMHVAESWFHHERDHRAMIFAIHRLAKRNGWSVDATINKKVSEFERGFAPRRQWVTHLTTACEKPEGFRFDWPGEYQHACFAIVRRIRDHRAGRLKDPCKGAPDQWRARGAPSRKARRLYYQVGCGKDSSHNWFDSSRRPNGKRRR